MSEVSAFVRYYRGNPRAYLLKCHRGFRARAAGQPAGGRGESRPWLGLDVLDRDEYVAWALRNPEFIRLWKQWQDNGCHTSYSPCNHRIDRARGYATDNIRFMTKSEKSIWHVENKGK